MIVVSRRARQPEREDIRVLLLYNHVLADTQRYVLDSYRSVLEEEGIPYEAVTPQQLLTEKIGADTTRTPALLIPDGVCRILPGDMKFWVGDFLDRGGNVWMAFDAGTQNMRRKYLNQAVFDDLLGVNYILYDHIKEGGDAHTSAPIQFRDEQALADFQIPPGKVDECYFLTGYRYGRLQYPMAVLRTYPKFRAEAVRAWGVTEEGKRIPAIVEMYRGQGRLLYINMPLGHLKAYADDLPLRSLLRSFLLRICPVPRLVNLPRARPGLVINWHIDSNEDWRSIPDMTSNFFLRPKMRFSLHITAGDFRDQPGDGLGFDACGTGRGLVDLLRCFGTIGSHGGWAHNWFSGRLNSGQMTPVETARYIRMNSECLETFTGRSIREYSAPNGVHPQPQVTEILEKLGFLAYYYTGDTGSMPNRTFSKGVRVSEQVIAFPIVPLEKAASFYEMNNLGYSREKVGRWLEDLLAYIVRERTLRLIYSHPYDIPLYPEALTVFLDRAGEAVDRGELAVEPMSYFAGFLQRFFRTRSRFVWHGDRLEISLSNPLGLKEMAVAIPRRMVVHPVPDGRGWTMSQDDRFYFLTIEEECHEKTLFLSRR